MEEKSFKNEYRTGNTRPPKSYLGILSFALIALILLCGVVSILGAMNVRLMQLQQEDSVEFSHYGQAACYARTPADPGFSGESVSAFWQTFSQLPQGVYITEIDTASHAYAAGLRQGDVVLCVDGALVRNMKAVENCLINKHGRTVTVQLYRNGQLILLDIALPEE